MAVASEWATILAAVGAWMIPLAGFVWRLNRRSQDDRAEMKDLLLARIEAVDGKLSARMNSMAEESRDDHKELRAQVAGQALTFSQEYVRRGDFAQALSEFKETMKETRNEIGQVRNRLDAWHDKGV